MSGKTKASSTKNYHFQKKMVVFLCYIQKYMKIIFYILTKFEKYGDEMLKI